MKQMKICETSSNIWVNLYFIVFVLFPPKNPKKLQQKLDCKQKIQAISLTVVDAFRLFKSSLISRPHHVPRSPPYSDIFQIICIDEYDLLIINFFNSNSYVGRRRKQTWIFIYKGHSECLFPIISIRTDVSRRERIKFNVRNNILHDAEKDIPMWEA